MKSTTRGSLRRLAAVATAGVVATVLASCGEGESGSEGSSDGPIVVGAFAGISGPIALSSKELVAGYELAFDEVNAAGGIDGREIELVVIDDSYDPAKGVAAVRELVERENASVVTGLGTATVLGVRDYLEGKQIPMLFPIAASKDLNEPPAGYTLVAQSSYESQAYLSAKYSIENKGSSKIGILRLDSDQGVDVANGCTQAAEEAGVEIVGDIAAQPTSTSFSGSLAKLRAAGADAICNGSTLESTGIQMNEAEDMGWRPDWFGFVTQANSQLAELGGPQAQGMIVATPLQFSADDPEIQEFRDALAEASPDTKVGYYSAFGYWSAHLIADALKEAGGDASPTEIRDAVLQWSEHPSPAGLSGPLTFSEDQPNGLTSSFIAELRSDDWEIVSGPEEPES